MSQSDSIVHIYLSNHNISPRFRRINYVWVFTLIVNLKLKFDARVYGSMRSPFFFLDCTMALWNYDKLIHYYYYLFCCGKCEKLSLHHDEILFIGMRNGSELINDLILTVAIIRIDTGFSCQNSN